MAVLSLTGQPQACLWAYETAQKNPKSSTTLKEKSILYRGIFFFYNIPEGFIKGCTLGNMNSCQDDFECLVLNSGREFFLKEAQFKTFCLPVKNNVASCYKYEQNPGHPGLQGVHLCTCISKQGLKHFY